MHRVKRLPLRQQILRAAIRCRVVRIARPAIFLLLAARRQDRLVVRAARHQGLLGLIFRVIERVARALRRRSVSRAGPGGGEVGLHG